MRNLFLSSQYCAQLSAAAVLACAPAGMLHAEDQSAAVGQVTFVIGKPLLADTAGQTRPLARGSWVHTGDTIKTAEGAHVHVRFTDGALISVRPGSRLVVEAYQFNPNNPQLNTVKFKLDSGTARAISGAAAETAKERFRLNTPLVAIGVRGTDFVVSSLGETTTATVNQGAIVMAPFAEGCIAADLGPCGSTGARLISADMGNVLAEYTAGLKQPVVKDGVGAVQASLGHRGSVAGVGQRNHPTSGQPDSMQAKDASTPSLVLAANTNDAIASDVLTGLSHAVSNQPPVSLPPPGPKALMWGRWSDATSAQDISSYFLSARVGREVTVGTDMFALYRAPGTFSNEATGNVSFRLDSAYAQYTPAAGAVQDAVASNGQLSIQFGTQDFTTQLQLKAPSAGIHQLSASGKLDTSGIFRANNSGQVVLGAVAFDAQSAGYSFQKSMESGTFKGITLWSR